MKNNVFFKSLLSFFFVLVVKGQDPNMFMPKASELNPLLMPMMMPQISDPRIEIQTFNAPNAPLMPDVLPKPIIDLDVNLPDQTLQSRPPIIKTETVIDEVKDHQKYNSLIVRDLASEFAEAMRKHDRTHRRHYMDGVGVNMGGEQPTGRISIALNPEQRIANQMIEMKKFATIERKLRVIGQQYQRFRKTVFSKLESLGFLFEKRRVRNLNFALTKRLEKII